MAAARQPGSWRARSTARRGLETVAAVLAIDAGVAVAKALARQVPYPEGQPAVENPVGHPAEVTAKGTSGESVAPPERGLKPVAMEVFRRIGDDRVLAEAASVTYYSLLAIFPAIAALVSLYGLVADPAAIGKSLDALSGVMPGGGVQIISDQIHSLTSSPHKALGLGAVVGMLTSVWSANAGVKSLFDALNAVYEQRESRSFLHRTWLSLAFTLGALAFVILAMGAVVVVPAVLAYLGLGTAGDMLLSLGRWPVLLGGLMLFLAFTYRFGPSRTTAKWRWISWGSAFAAIVWVLGSCAFSWYVANFGSYNKTYGSLGAAVGFMTWIWVSTIIVLVGAELNAELEQRVPDRGDTQERT